MSAEFQAFQEVGRAKQIIERALADWFNHETYDLVNDAAELLKLAAWRLGTWEAA